MITEDYCSFKVAKLLKEKGFDERCNSYFISDNDIALISNKRDFNNHGIYLSAPTHQMAMKWLREVHNLFIFPFPQRNTDSFWIEIYSIDKDKNEEDKWENLYCETIDLKNYSTYEEAVEAALKYSLENLI